MCQVESCGRELNALSTYHQRCRICEVHLKLTSFEHRAKQQRFCQQARLLYPTLPYLHPTFSAPRVFEGPHQRQRCYPQAASSVAQRVVLHEAYWHNIENCL